MFKLILKHKGRVALSDDSHGPHAVGLNYDRLADYLRTSHVEEIWYLQPSSNATLSGRPTCPNKVDGNWWEDSFWSTRLCG